jgi:murein DD-endopeptidase MepM/ murein hydrolase activator NlpD
MRRAKSTFAILLLTLFTCVSCTSIRSNVPAGSAEPEPTLPQPRVQVTRTPVLVSPTLLDEPTIHIQLTITPIQSEPVLTQTIEIDTMCSPLEDHPVGILSEIVSDPYNPPPAGKDGRHMGVDFSYYQWEGREGIAGVTVQSMLPGKVIAVLANQIPYGYAVIVETPADRLPSEWLQNTGEYALSDSLYLLYAHLQNQPPVVAGDNIQCSQQIGLVGDTGGVDTPYAIPHLHLEMRFGPPGAVFEDMGFYDTRVSELARQNYLTWRTSGLYRHFDPLIMINNYLKSSP